MLVKPNFKLTSKALSLPFTSEVVIEPLPVNFGHTVGNALRRVLLTNLEGAAAVRVKIAGVTHQFSTLNGVHEDILQFILNLKQVRFSLENADEATVTLNASGEKIVTAADLDLPTGVKIANPDQVLANLTASKAKLQATITVVKGMGYTTAEENAVEEAGVIPLDASFSPILRANYTVEATRVGRRTDFEKIRLVVTTDGTTTADDAVHQAAKILTAFYTQVFNPVFEESASETAPNLKNIVEQPIEDLDLPTRVTNALKKGGFKTFSDLNGIKMDDLLKVKNLGGKSAEMVAKKAKAKGVIIV